MNVEIGTVAQQFLFWEYLVRIFGIGSLQCTPLVPVTNTYYHVTHSGFRIQKMYDDFSGYSLPWLFLSKLYSCVWWVSFILLISQI
jgi:hypothetical protein